jgi:hypothetical protein
MPEYDLWLAEELAVAAKSVEQTELSLPAQDRMRLYLALLSIELSLKAMLEKAGVPISQIRARSHRLADLLGDIDHCTVEVTPPTGAVYRATASRLRSVEISAPTEHCTFGQLIDGLNGNVSNYPNQIRYGSHLRHYDASLVADAAKKAIAFARIHWTSLRVE